MVVIPHKMKKSMDYDTVKLFLELDSELDCIFTDGIDADEEVAREPVSLTVVEGDYVGEIVVMKKPLVNVEHIIVRAKDYGDVPYPENFALCGKPEPFAGLPTVAEFEASVLKII